MGGPGWLETASNLADRFHKAPDGMMRVVLRRPLEMADYSIDGWSMLFCHIELDE